MLVKADPITTSWEAVTDNECAKFNFIKGRSVNPVANGILKQIAFYKWGMPLDYKIYRVPREFTHDHNVKVQFLSCANIISDALSRGMIFPSQKGLWRVIETCRCGCGNNVDTKRQLVKDISNRAWDEFHRLAPAHQWPASLLCPWTMMPLRGIATFSPRSRLRRSRNLTQSNMLPTTVTYVTPSTLSGTHVVLWITWSYDVCTPPRVVSFNPAMLLQSFTIA